MLESIFKPLKAEKKPWELFFYGLLIASFSLFLSYWVFKEGADLVMLFFIVFACVPLMYHSIRLEEKKTVEYEEQETLLKEHSRLIAFFTFLFLGILTAFVIWYVFLPTPISSVVFDQQTSTLTHINSKVLGDSIGSSQFVKFITNNFKVLTFCIMFSFFFGTGAIFILVWNASVIAVAIGVLIKTNLAKYALAAGFTKIAAYLHSFSFAYGRYLLHGLPEMIAYMVAGLAGGIISAAVINKDFRTRRFEKIMLDVSHLLLLAILILVIAALMEAYLTPALF